MAATARLEAVVTAQDRSSAVLRRVGQQIAGLMAPIRRVAAEMRAVEGAGAMAQAQAAITGLSRQVVGLHRAAAGAVAGLRGLAIGGGLFGTSLLALAARSAASTAEMLSQAQAAGMDIAAFGRLSYAARAYHLDQQSLTTSMQRFDRVVVAAASGNRAAVAAFQHAGVAIRDANGQVRPTEAILQDLAETFSRVPDGPLKTALAMQLFGRAGAAMIPLLNQGRAGLQAMAEESDLFGVRTREGAEQAREFDRMMIRINQHTSGFAGMVGGQLVPILRPVLEQVEAWTRANRVLIRQNVREWGTQLRTILQNLIDPASTTRVVLGQVGNAAAWIWQQFSRLTQGIGGPTVAVLGLLAARLAVPIFGPLIAPLLGVTGGVLRLGWALLYPIHHFGTMMQALDAVGTRGARFLDFIWRAIAGLVRFAASTAAAAARMALMAGSAALGGLRAFAGLVWQGIAGLVRFAAAAAAATARLAAMAVGQAAAGIARLAAAIWAAIPAVWSFTVALLANPIVWIVGLIALLAGAVYLIYANWDSVGPWFGTLWDSVKTVFQGVIDFVAGIFTGDMARVATGLQEIWNGLLGFFGTLWDGVRGVFLGFVGWLDGIFGTNMRASAEGLFPTWEGVKSFFERLWAGITDAFRRARDTIQPIVDWVRQAADTVGGV